MPHLHRMSCPHHRTQRSRPTAPPAELASRLPRLEHGAPSLPTPAPAFNPPGVSPGSRVSRAAASYTPLRNMCRRSYPLHQPGSSHSGSAKAGDCLDYARARPSWPHPTASPSYCNPRLISIFRGALLQKVVIPRPISGLAIHCCPPRPTPWEYATPESSTWATTSSGWRCPQRSPWCHGGEVSIAWSTP